MKSRKRKRLGRAVNSSVGRANRFSAWSTFVRDHRQAQPGGVGAKVFRGSTPPPKSFLITSCTNSMVPAFSRCHSIKRAGFNSHRFDTTAKWRTELPSSNSSSASCECGWPRSVAVATLLLGLLPGTKGPPRTPDFRRVRRAVRLPVGFGNHPDGRMQGFAHPRADGKADAPARSPARCSSRNQFTSPLS